MLKPHAPSPPYRNPVCHFYFQARDPNGEHTFFFTIGYAALYAGHHFITRLLNEIEDCETHWLDNDQLLITHTPTLSTLLIKGELEDAIEYQPPYRDWETDRKSTRLNSSHSAKSRMPSSA